MSPESGQSKMAAAKQSGTAELDYSVKIAVQTRHVPSETTSAAHSFS